MQIKQEKHYTDKEGKAREINSWQTHPGCVELNDPVCSS
jgi:hypothetical protein